MLLCSEYIGSSSTMLSIWGANEKVSIFVGFRPKHVKIASAHIFVCARIVSFSPFALSICMHPFESSQLFTPIDIHIEHLYMLVATVCQRAGRFQPSRRRARLLHTTRLSQQLLPRVLALAVSFSLFFILPLFSSLANRNRFVWMEAQKKSQRGRNIFLKNTCVDLHNSTFDPCHQD